MSVYQSVYWGINTTHQWVHLEQRKLWGFGTQKTISKWRCLEGTVMTGSFSVKQVQWHLPWPHYLKWQLCYLIIMLHSSSWHLLPFIICLYLFVYGLSESSHPNVIATRAGTWSVSCTLELLTGGVVPGTNNRCWVNEWKNESEVCNDWK